MRIVTAVLVFASDGRRYLRQKLALLDLSPSRRSPRFHAPVDVVRVDSRGEGPTDDDAAP